MLSLIGIILFFGRNNRAHSNRCIANTWTLAQLFERVMDSFWRTDYYRGIVEFALHTVAGKAQRIAQRSMMTSTSETRGTKMFNDRGRLRWKR